MQRKRYHLVIGEIGPRAYVLDDGPVRSLDPRSHLRPDLPFDFEWGLKSRRATRLALAILADWTRDEAVALGLAYAFMLDVVAPFDKEIGAIEGAEVQQWLDELQADGIDTYALA